MRFIKRGKDKITWTSKVARRIFTTFVLCAVIPLLIMASVCFFFVGRQLETQAELRLHQQCKSKGFSIYERLLSLDEELEAASHIHFQGRLEDIVTEPYNPNTREGSGLRRVFMVMPEGRVIRIVDRLDHLPIPEHERLCDPAMDQAVISIHPGNGPFPHIYIARNIDPRLSVQGVIAGEIDPLYLWDIGTEGALPPEIDMSVITAGSEVLISSIPDFRVDEHFLKAQSQESFAGRFENTQSGKPFNNSYWSLFLQHRFSSPDWLIVLSQSKESIMAPVFDFKTIFFLLVLLTFWVILLLSVHAIRKRTLPIETLKAGASKIAQGEFGFQIDISSGDEFESLAQTFNEMSTKIKKGQKMFLQAAKMSTLGQMGAGIVHEIGQPLTAISGYTELLKMGVEPEEQDRYLSTICREIERLKAIISKFRTFSRVSEEVFTRIDINLVLDKTLDLLDHPLKMNGVELERVSDSPLPPIVGDENALQQAFLNLINNAVDALEEKTKGERKIRITSSAGEGGIRVEIADNGCGIPKEIQQSIYDPFFTTKGEDKGTGLGLAITSSILHKHNAAMELVSKPDEGTCFILIFPVVQSDSGSDVARA
jgi:signal transduction histidine kinase